MTPRELLREAELMVAQAIAARTDGSDAFTPEERRELTSAWMILVRVAREARS